MDKGKGTRDEARGTRQEGRGTSDAVVEMVREKQISR